MHEYYAPFDTRRIDKAKWRHIDNPTGDLKTIQSAIYSRILARTAFPASMCGGIAGRSIKDNATFHRGARKIVTLDLKACFHNTPNRAIYDVWVHCFGCNAEIAAMLTKLTTFKRRLPQGASTSTTLANLAMLPMHLEIAAIAARYDVGFSQFIDDIALSGPRASEVIEPVVEAIGRHGYGVSNRKQRIMRAGECLEVTGLAVGDEITVPQSRVDALIHDVHAIADRGMIYEDEERHVEGVLNWVKWIHPKQGEKLELIVDSLLPEKTGTRNRIKKTDRRSCIRGWSCLARQRREGRSESVGSPPSREFDLPRQVDDSSEPSMDIDNSEASAGTPDSCRQHG